MTRKFLRPFITGYRKTNLGRKEHNHTIAMTKFMDSFNKEGYYITPLLYPENHGFCSPISIVYKIVNGKMVNVCRIYWKRHPEVYDFVF